MPKNPMKSCTRVFALVAALSFSACGGGGSTTPPPPPAYSIGGTVQGLSGAGLVLQENAGNNLSVVTNGAFTFTAPLASSSAYNVTVLTQPSGPAQNCMVTNGNGTAYADVTNVQIACVGEWTWVGGSQLQFLLGTYGNLGSAAPNNIPGARDSAVSWTDPHGNLWLFGGELIDDEGPAEGLLNDLWKYNPSSGEWTWMRGSNTTNQSGSYGTPGTASPSNVPGARWGAVAWTDASGNLWLFGGDGFDSTGAYGGLNDLWKYNSSSGEWTWMSGATTISQPGTYGTLGTAASANIPGARSSAATWTDTSGNFWLFGGAGNDSAGTSGGLNDLWKYNLNVGEWTWMGGSDVVNQPGAYGIQETAAPSNVPGARIDAASWIDGSGNLWLFGGRDFNSSGVTLDFLNDLWKYSAGEWTWISGSNMVDQMGTYGTQGIAAPGNAPGARSQAVSWSDADGNFWFFGGSGYDSQGNSGVLNDLWNYSAGQWTWMGGADLSGVAGIYGTQGMPAPGNVPGSRLGPPIAWTDPSGNFWLFGGFGVGAGSSVLSGLGEFNDLWQYQP